MKSYNVYVIDINEKTKLVGKDLSPALAFLRMRNTQKQLASDFNREIKELANNQSMLSDEEIDESTNLTSTIYDETDSILSYVEMVAVGSEDDIKYSKNLK